MVQQEWKGLRHAVQGSCSLQEVLCSVQLSPFLQLLLLVTVRRSV